MPSSALQENGALLLEDAEFRWGDDILHQLQRGSIKIAWIAPMVREQMATEKPSQRHMAVYHMLAMSWARQHPKSPVEEFRAADTAISKLAWQIVLR